MLKWWSGMSARLSGKAMTRIVAWNTATEEHHAHRKRKRGGQAFFAPQLDGFLLNPSNGPCARRSARILLKSLVTDWHNILSFRSTQGKPEKSQ